jgi:hypothetical protein
VKPTAAEVLRALVRDLPKCWGCDNAHATVHHYGLPYCDGCGAIKSPPPYSITRDLSYGPALRAALECLAAIDAESAQAVVSMVVAANMPVGTTKRQLVAVDRPPPPDHVHVPAKEKP